MKEAIVQADLSVHIVNSPIPNLGADQILIQVFVSGCNPKDWKQILRYGPANSGDDIAGIVQAIGEDVSEFTPGDRVAAYHESYTPNGSYSEYAIALEHATFHLPKNVSFEEAATIPLAAMTAALGLYQCMGLPEPWSPRKLTGKQPLLVYGAASAVGAFAIQFAMLSDLHPIIGVAGNGIPFAESLIDKSKGDAIVDYRAGGEATIAGIKAALQAAGCADVPLRYSFDGISEHGSSDQIGAVLDPNGGQVTCVRARDYLFFHETCGARWSYTLVTTIHRQEKEFAHVWFRYFTRLLAEGSLKGHPFEKRGGLEEIGLALKDLKAGKASGVKYIFAVGDSAL